MMTCFLDKDKASTQVAVLVLSQTRRIGGGMYRAAAPNYLAHTPTMFSPPEHLLPTPIAA
jgi:hypothetical protein